MFPCRANQTARHGKNATQSVKTRNLRLLHFFFRFQNVFRILQNLITKDVNSCLCERFALKIPFKATYTNTYFWHCKFWIMLGFSTLPYIKVLLGLHSAVAYELRSKRCDIKYTCSVLVKRKKVMYRMETDCFSAYNTCKGNFKPENILRFYEFFTTDRWKRHCYILIKHFFFF